MNSKITKAIWLAVVCFLASLILIGCVKLLLAMTGNGPDLLWFK